jgi:hypothetical protein
MAAARPIRIARNGPYYRPRGLHARVHQVRHRDPDHLPHPEQFLSDPNPYSASERDTKSPQRFGRYTTEWRCGCRGQGTDLPDTPYPEPNMQDPSNFARSETMSVSAARRRLQTLRDATLYTHVRDTR